MADSSGDCSALNIFSACFISSTTEVLSFGTLTVTASFGALVPPDLQPVNRLPNNKTPSIIEKFPNFLVMM